MERLSFLQKRNYLLYGGVGISFIVAFVIGVLLTITNAITIETFVNFVIGISTLFTSFIILFTLFEMIEQRLSTIKPAIFVKNSAIMINWDKEPHGPLNFSIEDKKTIESDKNNEHPRGFECYNIGLGAAQKIHISYNFDIQKMIEKIKELDKDSKVSIKFKNSTLVIGTESYLQAYPQEITDKIRIDYILPTNIDSTPTYIPLPELFIDLFSVYLYLLLNSLEKSDESLNKITEVNKCNLIIKYQDIGNEQYIKKYEIGLFLIYQRHDKQKLTGSTLNIRVRELDK